MTTTLPSEGLSLCGAPDELINTHEQQGKNKNLLLVTIPSELRESIRTSTQNGSPAEFIAGKVPTLRINGKTHELSCSTEMHRHELYHNLGLGAKSNNDMAFAGTIVHTARVPELEKVAEAAGGAEAAEEQLKRSLQRLQDEKESKKANIMNTVTAAPPKKNRPGRLLNVLQPSLSRKVTQSMPSSPSFPGTSSSPVLEHSITSASNSQSQQPEQMRALRSALIHFLAIRPSTESIIARKTHSRKEDIAPILLKVAKPTANSSEWQLLDKSYKELDVWRYRYPSEAERQSAIDCAIRAYDRQRLAQSDPLWQILLPKQERGKGKILSRLAAHLGPKTNFNATPRLGPKNTDVSTLDGATDATANDNSNARPGEAMKRSASQEATKKKKPSEREAQSKRLLSKNPQKAQAAFEAKQKKQQEKEVAKSGAKASRPAKAATGGSTTTKQTKTAKSLEFVHDSDEEEVELEIAATTGATKRAETSQGHSVARKRPAEDMAKTSKSLTSTKKADSENQPPDAKKRRLERPQELQKKTASNDTAKTGASAKSGTAKSTAKGLNVPTNGKSKPKSDISPRKSDTRPEVPSPLGAAKPLTASYDTQRIASQVTPDGKNTRKVTAPSPLAQSTSSSSSKDQADRSGRTSASTNHNEARIDGRPSTEGTPSDPKRLRAISAASSQVTTSSDRPNGTPSSISLKRKAIDVSKDTPDHESPRKTAKVDITTSRPNGHDRKGSGSTATPGEGESDPLSATSEEFPERLTPRQCRRLCERMQTYYKTYEASRTKLEATPKHKRDPQEVADHWRMHNRLLEMKKMIWNADIPRSEGEPRSWGEYEVQNVQRRYTDAGAFGGSS